MPEPVQHTDADAQSGTLAEYARQFTSLLDRHKTDYSGTDSSALLFALHGETFALPATTIVEVLLPPKIHSIPGCANRLATGLVNYRGELTICASLDKLLNLRALPPRPDAPARLIIVVWQSSMMGFVADEVFGVARFRKDSLGSLPASINTADGLVLGVLEAAGRLASVLSVDALFAALHHPPPLKESP